MSSNTPHILFKDNALIVLEKPSGMPSLRGHLKNSAEEWLQEQYPTAKLVHRLDNDTSGLMVAAKSEAVFQRLRALWNTPNVVKKYRALVCGKTPPQGKIQTPIAHHPRKKKKMLVGGKRTRPAETHYRTLKHLKNYSLVEVQMTTGVRHQIRTHMASVGHPLAGDKLYQKGKKHLEDSLGLTRFMLHLTYLKFPHPLTGEKCEYESPFDDSHCDLAFF